MSFKSLAVLSAVNFLDAISYMCVAPSLIFYVQSVGGTKEQYGLIMSAFSLASFCGKPVYGLWVDKSGNQFRAPYIASFILSIAGGIFYASAPAFDSPGVALAMILTGRVLGGLGAGNAALGYAYLALTVPFDKQTQTNSLLSMARIRGMALGPVANILLADIDTTVTVFGKSLHLDALNSVGLLLAGFNILIMIIFVVLMQEPDKSDRPSAPKAPSKRGRRMSVEQKRDVWKAVFCIEIMLPLMVILIVNSNFQL
jgi:MFS family permease